MGLSMPKGYKKRVKNSKPAPVTPHAQQSAKPALPRHRVLACRPVDETLKDVFLSRVKQLDELANSLSSLLSSTVSASFVQLSLNMIYASFYPAFENYNRYFYVHALDVYATVFAEKIDPAHHNLMQDIIDFYLSLQSYPHGLEQYSEVAPLFFNPFDANDIKFPLRGGNITRSELALIDPHFDTMVGHLSYSGFILSLIGSINEYVITPNLALLAVSALDLFLLYPVINKVLHSAVDMRRLSTIRFKDGMEGRYGQVDQRLQEIRKQKNWLTPVFNQTFNVLKSYVLIMLFVNLSTELNWVPLIQFDDEESTYWKVCLYTVSILMGVVFHGGYFTKEKRDLSAQEAALNALIDIFDGILAKDAIEMIETEKVTDTMYCISVDHIVEVDDISGNFKTFINHCEKIFRRHDINVIPNKSNHQVYVDYNNDIVNLKDDIKAALVESVRSQQWAVIQRSEPLSDSESAKVAHPSYYSMLGGLWCCSKPTSGNPHRKGPKSLPDYSPEVVQAAKPAGVVIEIDGCIYNSENLLGSTMFPLDIGDRSDELSHFGTLDQSLCDDPKLVERFIEQLRRGTSGSRGKNGIRILKNPQIKYYKYEIKLTKHDARYYGHEVKHGDRSLIVFDQYEAHPHQRSAFRR